MAGGGGSPRLYQNADFFNSRFWLFHKKIVRPQNRTRVYVHFLLARQSHQAPRSVTVLVLLLVGIFWVHYLYLNPKICKYQIFSTDILSVGHGKKSYVAIVREQKLLMLGNWPG
jgi:hypothetical protein